MLFSKIIRYPVFILFLFSSIIGFGQNVGINTTSPGYTLDARGTDDITSGGELQLSTPSQTNFLRFFGGRLGDPHPFIGFNELDTFHFITTNGAWSTFNRLMTIAPNGFTGHGVDKPLAQMHISSNSTTATPNLRITEETDNFARIKMETQTSNLGFWDIAASSTPNFTHFNLFFSRDTFAQNILSIDPENGAFNHRSLGNNNINYSYINENSFVGYDGYYGKNYYLNTSEGKIVLSSSNNFNDIVIDTSGFVGLGTYFPKAELDIVTDDADDGASLRLGTSTQSNFLRLFSGKTSLNKPLIYWNHGSFLEFGQSFNDDSQYTSFMTLDGRTIGIHNNGGSVFIGEDSGANEDGNDRYNTALGKNTLLNCSYGGHNVAIGNNTLVNYTEGDAVAVGDSALHNNGMNINIAPDAQYNTAIGAKALLNNDQGHTNTALGFSALKSNVTGDGNTAIGVNALLNNYVGESNTAIGAEAMEENDSGQKNVSIGRFSMNKNTMGSENTVLGFNGMFNNIDGDQNVSIGLDAMYSNSNGSNNVALGYRSLISNFGGDMNIAIGTEAISSGSNSNSNVAIGHEALQSSSGSNNTIIGAFAGKAGSTTSNNVFIGYSAGYNESGNNKLYIENTNSTSPLIYGEFNNNFIKINGDQEVTGNQIVNGAQEVTGNFTVDGGLLFGNSITNLIGVGTTSPETKLHVKHLGTTQLKIESSSGNDAILQLSDDSNINNDWTLRRDASDGGKFKMQHDGFQKLTITPSGNVGIGSSVAAQSPVYNLFVDGSAGKPGGGSWTTSSDRRLKKDINPYKDGLNEIDKINTVTYQYNEISGYDISKEYVGVIAQELQKIAPYMVSEDNNGYLAVDNSAMMYMLVNAVKTLKKENTELIEKVERLNSIEKEFLQIKIDLERIRAALNLK